jgi:hypothetical protein
VGVLALADFRYDNGLAGYLRGGAGSKNIADPVAAKNFSHRSVPKS